MPCPLLERYISFLPEEDTLDIFAAHDIENVLEAVKKLCESVRAESYDKDRTHRRVGSAANLFLAMLYMGNIKQLSKEMLEKRALPYTRTDDVFDAEYLNHWLTFGTRRLSDLNVAHAEFALDSEDVRRGALQIADQQRMFAHGETTAICEAVRTVQKYIKDPTCGYAGLVGQRLYDLCECGSMAFALQQGQRLLEVT